MSVTHTEIDGFYAFAQAKLAAGGAESMSELFDLYLLEHPTEDEDEEVRAAIAHGLADVAAGRVRPAEKVMAELRQKYGLKPS